MEVAWGPRELVRMTSLSTTSGLSMIQLMPVPGPWIQRSCFAARKTALDGKPTKTSASGTSLSCCCSVVAIWNVTSGHVSRRSSTNWSNCLPIVVPITTFIVPILPASSRVPRCGSSVGVAHILRPIRPALDGPAIPLYQFVYDPSLRCRCGASANRNGSLRDASSTSTPSPGRSERNSLSFFSSPCTGNSSLS